MKSNILIGVMVLVIVVSYTMSWFWGGLNQDVVYYMNVEKLMVEGAVPYADFRLGYTPLVFYLLYLPVSLFGNQLPVALSCVYIALLVDAFIVYAICKRIANSKSLAVFGALLFLMQTRICNSDDFYLEPFVLLSGLSAILLLNYSKLRWMIAAGFFCFMAFWTKQYGIGFIFLASAYVLIDQWFTKAGWLRVSFLWLGFIIGATIFIGLLTLQGVSLQQMFTLSGSDYQREGFQGLWLGTWHIFRWFCPSLLILPLSFLNIRKMIKEPYWGLSILGIGGFLIQTYVRAYGHYLILMCPFCVFILIFMLKNVEDKRWAAGLKVLSVIMILSLIHRIYLFDADLYENRNGRTDLMLRAQTIEQYIPRGSHDVYAFSAYDKLLAYHLETLPPVENKKCLVLSFEGNEAQLIESIKSSSYVIANGLGNQSVREVLDELFVKKVVAGFDIYIHKSKVKGGE